MREIKFRAWEDNKKLEEDLGLDRKENSLPNKMHTWKEILRYNKIWVSQLIFGEFKSHIILMQFTGLKDKNGKEIYEGDIVEYSKCLFIVEWEDDSGCFYLKQIKEDNIIHDIRMNRLDVSAKIVGNKFENPELLEKSK